MNRKFDTLGRLVIPKEMRSSIGLTEGSTAHIIQDGNRIIITNPSNEDKFIDYLDDLYQNSEEATKELLQNILRKYIEYK